MKVYTYGDWEKEFQPMPNSIRNNGDLQYETYGEEQEYVRQQDERNIWTEVDGDNGTYLIAGYRLVNRIQYFITTVPWEDDAIEVPTQLWRDCDCTIEVDENPDCTQCAGYGIIDIPCNTVLELQQVYKNFEIVGGN